MFIVRLEANVRTRNLLFLIFRLMSNCPTAFLRFGIKAKLSETIRIKYKFLVYKSYKSFGLLVTGNN